MVQALFTNNAFSLLASGISSSDTSMAVTGGEGTLFPNPTGGDYFYATLIDTSNNLEIVKCTARSTDTFTIVRAQESTTGRAFVAGDRIELRLTAAGITEADGYVAPTDESTDTTCFPLFVISATGSQTTKTGTNFTFNSSTGALVTTLYDGIIGSVTPAAVSVTTLTTSGIVSIDDTTDTTSTTSGSIHTDGGLGVAKDVWVGATLHVRGDTAVSDAATLGYTSAEGLILTGQGSTNDITLKNDADAEVMGVPTGTTGATFKGVIRTDDTTTASSGTTGSIQTDGGLGVAGTAHIVGVTTHGGDVLSDTDSTDSLGSTGVRWLKLWADSIQTTANIDIGADLTVTGNFTVNGTTTTVDTTNMVVKDPLIELNTGASSNANDLGLLMERGSTGDNIFMGWDESGDYFAFGTTTATGSSTGNITYALGQARFAGLNLSGTSADLGTVTTIDIDGGSVDGVIVGANSAAAGTFTNLTSTGNTTLGNASGDSITFHPNAWTLSNAVTITGTWANLGTVTTVDINGGSLDAVTIGAASHTTIKGTTIEGTTSLKLATGATVTGIEDSDTLSSDSNTLLATQQSIKAYIDGLSPAPGIQMTWDTATDDDDEGAGTIKANNGTFASITQLFIDDVDNNSVSINAFIDTLDDPTTPNSAIIYLTQGGGTSTAMKVFQVDGGVTSATTYSKVSVTGLVEVGTFADGVVVGMMIAFSGDDGTDGDAGDVFKGVVAKTATYTVVAGDDDYVLTMDASGGARTFTLTAAATLGDGFVVTLKKIDSSSNAVTIDANSSETVDGALTVVLTSQYETTTLICDGSNWHTVLASTPGGSVTIDNYADSTNYTAGSTTTLTLSVSPASENSITVTFDGVMQHHDTYSLSGAVVTFDTAIPTGTSDVEITTIASLDIGTPADNTVGYDQLAHIGTANQILTSNGSGSAPSYQNPVVGLGLVLALG